MNKFLLCTLAGAMSLGFMACSNEDPAEPVAAPDVMQKTATVTGYILMNEDLVASKPSYTSPKAADFKMIVTIPYSELISGDVSGRTWSTTNVDYTPGTGKFSVVVPVGFAPTTVKLQVNDFTGSRREYDAVQDKNVDVAVIWQCPEQSAVVKAAGQVVYLESEPVLLDCKPIKVSGDNI